MAVNLKGRSFLSLIDFTREEIRYLLDLSGDLKAKKRLGQSSGLFLGKNIVLIFEKTSTRTRCAFEAAISDEGGHATYLDMYSSQMNKKESLEDTAKVLGRFYDGIAFRGFEQCTVEALAEHSGIPVWNGLTDTDHPTQILADLLTIEEHIHRPLHKVKIVFVGDTRNNMAYAWMHGCAKLGMDFVGLGPKELRPDDQILSTVLPEAQKTSSTISFEDDASCVKNADVVYTDIWASMGEEAKLPERVKLLSPYKVTMELFHRIATPDSIFMHCLPSFHDFETDVARKARDDMNLDIREVDDELFRSKYSVVFDEAENRLHTIKAIMAATL